MIGIGWAGPTILHGGTEAQKERYLFPLLAGEEIWCQLFSEPGAGLRPRRRCGTRAVRDGDEWVVNGQKIWTSLAQFSKFGILIARTDPEAPKHEGISYFICPMDAPGHRDPPDHRDDRLAHVQRGVPRRRAHPGREPGRRGRTGAGAWPRSPSATSGCRCRRGGALWGMGPTAGDLLDLVRAAGRRRPTRCCASGSPQLHIEAELLRLIRLRTVTARHQGRAARAPRRRSARCWPTSTASGSWAWPRTSPAPAGCSTDRRPAGRRRRPVALRLPVRPGPHRRRRHRRGAAQHRRRAGPRPPHDVDVS